MSSRSCPQDRRKRARDVWNAAETRLGMWVRGQLILMSAIGVGTGAAYTLLGVPAALLLGLIAAIAEAVPIVGPLLGAIPAVLVAATVSPQLAAAVAGAYLVLQLIEGNVLVPLVMRNTTGISPFLVIISVLIGGAAGGFVGALLAVPIAAAGEVLIEGLQAREVPVAQDPTADERTDDESNAPANRIPRRPIPPCRRRSLRRPHRADSSPPACSLRKDHFARRGAGLQCGCKPFAARADRAASARLPYCSGSACPCEGSGAASGCQARQTRDRVHQEALRRHGGERVRRTGR